ncbi:MAG: hypothetical protein ACT4PS_10405 [Betaproteobacteria bacterium]
MNIVPAPVEAQSSSERNAEAGVYSTKPRRPGELDDVVDAEVVYEDTQPRSLRLRIGLPDDFNIHAVIGTAVATLALGFALLLVALAGVLVAIEMLMLLITEPL